MHSAGCGLVDVRIGLPALSSGQDSISETLFDLLSILKILERRPTLYQIADIVASLCSLVMDFSASSDARSSANLLASYVTALPE